MRIHAIVNDFSLIISQSPCILRVCIIYQNSLISMHKILLLPRHSLMLGIERFYFLTLNNFVLFAQLSQF